MAFANQVAVITGASSGIGWELAKLLARRQCRVGVLARRLERRDALVAEIRAAGGQAEATAADVTSRDETLAGIARLRAALGPIDLLIANSGVGLSTKLEPINAAEIDNMI